MTTIADLYAAFCDLHGADEPVRTLPEVRDEFHRREFHHYGRDGEAFLDAVFKDGWAWGNDYPEKEECPPYSKAETREYLRLENEQERQDGPFS